MRRIIGQYGQTSGGRSFGGSGRSSNWCTEVAPWRFEVPRQSEPVSPPPRMTTRLPVGEDLVRRRGRRRRPCSAAAGTPSRSGCRRARARARAGRAAWSRRRRARPRRTRGAAASPVTSTPTCDAGPERHALGLHLLHAAVDQPLLHLEVGDAVAQQAADAVGALEERRRRARRARAAARTPCPRARSRRRRRVLPVCRSGALRRRPSPRRRRGR